MHDKVLYRGLADAAGNDLSLFHQPWWLDALAGESQWDVAVTQQGGQIVGALPYVLRRRFGKTQLTQPPLTQFLGPWISNSSLKPATLASRNKDILFELIDRLPHFDYYGQAWSPEVTNWSPFYWRGFRQTTRYTLRLNDTADLDLLLSGMQPGARQNIRKAANRFRIRLSVDPTIDDFLSLSRMTFERQGMRMPYSIETAKRMDRAAAMRGVRKILIAEDDVGRRHAGVYLVWDKNFCYYIMGGADPDLRNSEAASFAMWEAIKFASSISRRFDFEGSMIQNIERFFRSFGPTHCPYSFVSKSPSKLVRIRDAYLSLRG